MEVGRRGKQRLVLGVLGFHMELVCYADRTNIALAILPMAEEQGYDESTTGFILSSFFIGCGCRPPNLRGGHYMTSCHSSGYGRLTDRCNVLPPFMQMPAPKCSVAGQASDTAASLYSAVVSSSGRSPLC